MLNLFTYKTPSKFAADFKSFYSRANLNQVKILSITIFVITFLTRLTSLLYYKEVVKFVNYKEHSIGNWIQITGSFTFYCLSTIAIRSGNWNSKNQKIITLAFVVFILLITFGVSYTISLHNTKNTLTMFLIGIVTVSLFFAIEYREIITIAIFIAIIFVLSMVLPKIAFQDKLTNVIAAVILGAILISFSRYSYYFKSQHFVRMKELEEKNLEIERLNAQKDEILGFVAHDLRNPLNNIEALSKIMLLDDSNHSEAAMISSAALQAKEIINDLIEAVKTDKTILQTEKVDIVAYLSGIIKKWTSNDKRTFILKGLSEHIAININASKLERVIDNLITNALKFSAASQPVTVELINYKTHICISIKDQGIGIPVSLQQHIFNQFSTAGRTGLQGEQSIGLGLHISKRIIEQHNGQLTFESEENKGTTFTILLPVV